MGQTKWDAPISAKKKAFCILHRFGVSCESLRLQNSVICAHVKEKPLPDKKTRKKKKNKNCRLSLLVLQFRAPVRETQIPWTQNYSKITKKDPKWPTPKITKTYLKFLKNTFFKQCILGAL